MGMEQNNYDRYLELYECYKNLYDLPFIKTEFIQDDPKAMDYCESRDFVTLVVPFGDPGSYLKNQIVVQNNLVSYTKMYSDLLGGSACADMDFLWSAVNKVKKKANLSHLEEFTPIALIENSFIYDNKHKSHYGVVFMARIPKGKTLGKDVVAKSINDRVYFANPHNQVLFDLAKKYVENYKTNRYLQDEIEYARKIKIKEIKTKKMKFLAEQNIDLSDYHKFKQEIVDEIKKLSPQSIMDIACGDDNIIYDFLKINDKIKVYANDIALAYLEYNYSKPEHNKIIFSNLNAVSLPFKEKSLDVIFCKNLLHHLSVNDRKKLIANCLKICRRMVVVEILCCEEQNESGKLLHKKFYHDILQETDNKQYLSYEQIKALFDSSLFEISIERKVSTHNGVYCYLSVVVKST